MAYEALQKSILHDEREQFDVDKARGSEASGTNWTASDSAQDPLPPPPSPTTNPDDQSPGSAAPGSSKTAATTAYTAWTTTTSRFEPSASSIPEEMKDMRLLNLLGPFLHQVYLSPSTTGHLLQPRQQGIHELTPEHLEGPAYEVDQSLPSWKDHSHWVSPPGQVTIPTSSSSPEIWIIYDLSKARVINLRSSITKDEAALFTCCRARNRCVFSDQMWIKKGVMELVSNKWGRRTFQLDIASYQTQLNSPNLAAEATEAEFIGIELQDSLDSQELFIFRVPRSARAGGILPRGQSLVRCRSPLGMITKEYVNKGGIVRTEMELVPMIPPEPEGSTQGQSTKHPSDTYVFTMKMEILLEPTSNKLMVGPHGFEGTYKDGGGVNLFQQNFNLPSNSDILSLAISSLYSTALALASKEVISLSDDTTLALRVSSSCSIASSLVRGISRLSKDGTVSVDGVSDLHLLRDGLTDGDGDSEDDDDECINTVRLLRGGGDDDGCDVSNDEDAGRDLLRDNPKCGDDGAYDEDPNCNGDEYSDDEPDDRGGDAAIH
ncbi:hypothetical protein Tco_0347405 [Tanacetum coccineum]